MHCAIGHCGHCQLGPLFVCADGPVVSWACGGPAPGGAPMVSPATTRPTLAVWKFASCDGCQLTLLDCEDELLAVAERVDIAYFLEASRADRRPAPTTCRSWRARSRRPHDVERIAEIRAPISAPRHDRRLRHRRRHPGAAQLGRHRRSTSASSTPRRATSRRWPPRPRSPRTYRWTSSSAVARSTSGQLLDVISAFLGERRPNVPGHSVCVECKLRGNVCVMVARRHAVPRSDHPCRLRCAVPHLRPRLLRLLRPGGGPEPRVADRAALPTRCRATSTSCACCARSTSRRRRFATRAHATRPAERSEPDDSSSRLVAGLPGRQPSPASRVRAACTSRSSTVSSARCSCGSTSRPASSRRFLRGRAYTEPPDITARICGICPVAYQMSACNAIESLCGVTGRRAPR